MTTTTNIQFVQKALAEVGKPYCYGGTGPNCYDCSGLVYACLAQLGITAPRSSEEQYTWTTPVQLSELLPGMLIYEQWEGDNAPPGHVIILSHVNILKNVRMVVEAPHTGANVWVRDWSPVETTIVGYGKVPGLTYLDGSLGAFYAMQE